MNFVWSFVSKNVCLLRFTARWPRNNNDYTVLDWSIGFQDALLSKSKNAYHPCLMFWVPGSGANLGAADVA